MIVRTPESRAPTGMDQWILRGVEPTAPTSPDICLTRLNVRTGDQTGSVRRVVLFASVVVVVVLFVVLFSWMFQRRLIYLPATGTVPSAATTDCS